MSLIAIIDDDEYIGSMLERALKEEGYQVIRAYSGTEALLLFEKRSPDLVLLDLMLPGMDGFSVCRRLREETDIPILAHLARYQRLTGGQQRAKPELQVGGVRLNTETRRVFVDGREVELKNKEYALLHFLMLHLDMVFSREELYERIWGLEAMGDNATVAVHINRIREKIEPDPSRPRYIQTVWGAGYRFRGQ